MWMQIGTAIAGAAVLALAFEMPRVAAILGAFAYLIIGKVA